MRVHYKTHPELWDMAHLSAASRLLGVHVDDDRYQKYRAEADRIYPHLTNHGRELAAFYLSLTHPGFHDQPIAGVDKASKPDKGRWLLAIIILLLVGLICLMASRAHAAPPPDLSLSHYLVLHPPIFAQTITPPSLFKFDGSGNLDVNCITGCGAGGGGGTSSNFGAAFPTAGTAIGVKNGLNMVNLAADASSNLLVNLNTAIPTGANTIGAVTQASGPWTSNLTQVGGSVLGAIANYGTSPGAVLVPAVNAFITNTPTVTANAGSGQFNVTCTTANCPISLSAEAGTAVTSTPTAIGTLAAGNVITVNSDLTSEHGTAITNIPTAIGTLGAGNVTSHNVDLTSEHGTAITNVPTAIGTLGAGNVMSVNADITSVRGVAVTTATGGVMRVGIVGNSGAAIDTPNNSAVPANAVSVGAEAATQGTTQPTAATAGNLRRSVESTDGAQYVRLGGPVTWNCGNTGVTTLVQCQAAPGSSLKLYIGTITTFAQSSTAALFILETGTGTNCGTGTATLWPIGATAGTGIAPAPANTVAPLVIQFQPPLVTPVNVELCVLASASSNFQATGYSAP